MNKRIKKKHQKCTGSRDYIAKLRKEKRSATTLARRIELSKAIDKVKQHDKLWTENLRRYKAINVEKRRRYGEQFPFDNAVSFMYPHVCPPTEGIRRLQDALIVSELSAKLGDLMLTVRCIKPRPGERDRMAFTGMFRPEFSQLDFKEEI